MGIYWGQGATEIQKWTVTSKQANICCTLIFKTSAQVQTVWTTEYTSHHST